MRVRVGGVVGVVATVAVVGTVATVATVAVTVVAQPNSCAIAPRRSLSPPRRRRAG